MTPAIVLSLVIVSATPKPHWEEVAKRASAAASEKRYAEAETAYAEALKLAPAQAKGGLLYNRACAVARLGRKSEALGLLEAAVAGGYREFGWIPRDEDLATLRAEPQFQRVVAKARQLYFDEKPFRVTAWENADVATSAPLGFDRLDSPNMIELRKQYRLDEVVRSSKTQLDRQLALVSWVHGRWAHDGRESPSKTDATTILREAGSGKRFACFAYAVTLAQVFQAMGHPARVIYLSSEEVSSSPGAGHVVSEVWNDDLQKWLVVDPQNNATWRNGDALLSAMEVHALLRQGQAEKVRLVRGPSPWLEAHGHHPDTETWLPYFWTLRVTNAASYYDAPEKIEGVQWSGAGAMPELSNFFRVMPPKQSSDAQQLYPRLNRVHLDLQLEGETKPLPVAKLRFSHNAPWFARYVILANGKRVEQSTDTFRWPLVAGVNRLEVRAQNQGGVQGKPSIVELRYNSPRNADASKGASATGAR
jgi:hypothetical protein